MESEIKEKKNPLVGKVFRAFALFALMGGVLFAGVATYQVVVETFFATTTEGVSTTGFAPPSELIKGSTYALTGSFDNVANQAHEIVPSIEFVADTGFSVASEFGAVSLNGDIGTCVLSETTVADDTMNCEFDPITLGAEANTATMGLNFEVPLMWDGSNLSIAMQYNE